MRLKLDENFGRRGAEILAAAGHDVATVPAENLCRASDQEVARVCRAEGRCLVTLDLDFGNPLLFKPSDYAGLAVVRLRGKAEPTDLERALRVLVAGLETGSIAGKLWIVEPTRLREYQPEN
jgi:predicted nuclease of predicted toxin-antitoxin system